MSPFYIPQINMGVGVEGLPNLLEAMDGLDHQHSERGREGERRGRENMNISYQALKVRKIMSS